MNSNQQRHLDLGCGANPRNPYKKNELHGVDLRHFSSDLNIQFKQANLNLEKLPYNDNFFASVSAFDYLEHVPRILLDSTGKNTFFPFINLMNEIWRVLTPGGLLYALTPAYPSPAAFQDPTHVNIITSETHQYFCGENPDAGMYGFNGKFKAIRAEWCIFGESLEVKQATRISEWRRARREKRGVLSHFLWELEAMK